MIANWMIASTALAVLLGLAALAAERALRTVGREARGAWVFALAGTLGWPLVAPAVAAAFGRGPDSVAPILAPLAIDGSTVVTIGSAPSALPPAWVGYLDVALVALWACASLVLLARLLLAMRVLSRVERSAEHDVIEGVPVLVTPTIGPAVFGAHRPRVLMPRWLFDLDAPLRALVVRHEQEHCRARDPQLTLLVAFAIALTPWNAGVWWIAKRLRLAVEVDCDVRVLRHANDSERYSRLLLFIAQRQSHVRLAPMLAESNSHLSRRIDAMNAPRPTNPRIRTTAFALLAVAALAGSTRFAKELTAAPTIFVNAPGATPPVFVAQKPLTPSVQMPMVRKPDVPPAAMPAVTTAAPVPDTDLVIAHDNHPVMALPGSAQPRYPDILKSAGVEGGTMAAFVVNADGGIDTSSIKIIYTSHALFAEAFRAAAPTMHFMPAILNGQPVRQLVQEPFVFNIAGSVLASPEGQRATLERLLEAAGNTGLVTMPQVVITAVP
jgi:beta-lactamase regulating signal transducer with metallopeptidase domain